MSSSCKQFDGVITDNETIEKAKACLRLAFLYIDKTVDPPVFRYIEPNYSYEIIGWKREDGEVYYIVRLKGGTVLQISELELKHINVLLKIREKFNNL